MDHPHLGHVLVWCEECQSHYCAGCHATCPGCEMKTIIELNTELEEQLEASEIWRGLPPAEKEDVLRKMKTTKSMRFRNHADFLRFDMQRAQRRRYYKRLHDDKKRWLLDQP